MNAITSLPGIVNARPAPFEMRGVSRDHRQIVLKRGRGEQKIMRWQLGSGYEATPTIRDLDIHREYVFRKFSQNLVEPSLDYMSLLDIRASYVFDAFPDFPQRNHTQCTQARIVCHRPRLDATVCAVFFPQLGNEIRVEQVAHQISTSRRLHSRRSVPNSKSGAILPSSLMRSNKVRLLPASSAAGASAACKIRRCSSSVDTPCAAARSFSDRTTSSGIFLTNN